MHTLTGRCHCGNISVTFETNLDPANMEPRACQCSFCRMHSTAAVSDPDGHLTFTAVDPKQPIGAAILIGHEDEGAADDEKEHHDHIMRRQEIPFRFAVGFHSLRPPFAPGP